MQTTKDAQAICDSDVSGQAQEAQFKEVGLRDVENTFWKIPHADPHKLLLFDCLHAYDLGLFGAHLWPELTHMLETLGKKALKQIDTQMDACPRWRGLNHFDKAIKIQEFRLLKIHYESMVTWRTETDILRCSPQFHGAPQYDGVIVNYGTKEIFAKLLFLCLCTIDSKTWPLAYILPLDALIGTQTLKDRHLSLYRVCAKPRASCKFIPVRSVVRGVPIVNDPDVYSDYFIMDVTPKLFQHLKRMFNYARE
ncbi:hypothetical protein EW026_g3180 [Hermanssonia centrifuga]|uniref:Uncharacterized protein n=1 Tax=Hermanssonia centrifuga TaxID=98765 RepID=A0A4S4KKX2_9APHY|nr:hypothetical protein EW026_g3180 [Hermanssonia centrifuga]